MEGLPRRRGGPRAGDRVPAQLVTCGGRSIRLHELLACFGMHVLLDRDADRLDAFRLGRLVIVHRLSSVPGRGLTVVRPDGYIGFRGGTADTTQLTAWLARINGWPSA